MEIYIIRLFQIIKSYNNRTDKFVTCWLRLNLIIKKQFVFNGSTNVKLQTVKGRRSTTCETTHVMQMTKVREGEA